TCQYDKDTKELTINENKEHVSIFPDNINVTAIVGENGSGKSSLFEVLSKILTFNSGLEVFNYFYILNDGSKNICYSNNIDVVNDDITIEKNRNVALKNHFDVSYLNISHLERDGIIKNDSPSPEDPIEYYGIYKKNDFDLYKEDSLYPTFSGFKLSQFNFFQTFAIGNLLIDDKYKKLFFEVFKIKQPYSIKINYDGKKLNNIKTSNTPNGDTSRAIDASIPDKIDKIVEFLKSIDNNLIIGSNGYKTFFTLILSVVDLEKEFKLTFQTEDGKDIKLSAGEKTILFYLERIDLMLSRFKKDKCNILLFDEIELYLHPNWQKRILKIILDFIQESKLAKKLHIIITSHSPFILSDLPKENVIFLEKGKQVYPFDNNQQTFGANIHTLLSHGFFMKDGLMGEFAKGKINEAITLLNQKTLSENKINFCENIISIIGEPILKRQLQKMLDSKRLSEIEQIKQEIQRLEDRMTLIWKNSK
ncbi:MAG: AAA family ATPase, partial [Arcobacteraceae bacterium]